MSQMNPMLLASLAAAAGRQALLPPDFTSQQEANDYAAGQTTGDATQARYREAPENRRDTGPAVPHWEQDQRQPATSQQVRHSGPSMQYIAGQVPERKSQDQDQQEQPPTNQLDPTAYFQGQGTAAVPVPAGNQLPVTGSPVGAKGHPTGPTSVQVPAWLASNSGFQSALSHWVASGRDPAELIAQWQSYSHARSDRPGRGKDRGSHGSDSWLDES